MISGLLNGVEEKIFHFDIFHRYFTLISFFSLPYRSFGKHFLLKSIFRFVLFSFSPFILFGLAFWALPLIQSQYR